MNTPENKIVIHDELPYVGEILDMILPLDGNPEDKARQDEIIKDFTKSISHYQEAYFAYLRVKTDRAREIVGIPYYTESGREVELAATGWEGYYVGCRNPGGSEMKAADIVKAIARQGLDLHKSIQHIGTVNYDIPGKPTTSAMLKVAFGESFDDLEALIEVNAHYGAMLGRLRAYIGENRPIRMQEAELEQALQSYLNTGVVAVTPDADFTNDLKKYADFHHHTLSSLASIPSITFKFNGKAITTTCILPRPPENSPEGTPFKRYPVSLTHDEREGLRLANSIGLLGNPIIRATLSLFG